MTMKTYLALALLITVLAGNAYGEDEIYYCADNGSAGFNFNKNAGSYQMERGGIVLSKFKIKLDLANKRIVMATDDRGKVQFTCKNPVYFLNF